MIRCWLPALLATLSLATSPVLAQTSYPMLMSLKPVAAQVGQTSEHTVTSRYNLFGAYQVLVSGTGVTAKVVPVKKSKDGKEPSLTSLKLKFTVAPNALPGVRDFRLATPRGASTVGQVVIVHDKVVVETGNNNTAAKAQSVAVPSTICGAIEGAEDVDVFKFSVKKGDRLSFHVRAQRLQDRIHDLQSHVDPILTLRTATGTTLAASDNYFFADPFLSHDFTADGEYLLELRDVRYKGNSYWQYSIETSNRPFIETVFPLGIRRGQDTSLIPVGQLVPKGAMLKLNLPGTSPAGQQALRLPLAGSLSNPFRVVVSDLDGIVTEANADNNSPKQAQAVTLPTGINGRIESASDLDCYAFEAKKGDKYSFEIIARRIGSSLDSHLRILDAKGKQLQLNDDLQRYKRKSQDSWVENFTVPADGRYIIEVRDVHLRGGPRFAYFLRTTRATPFFELLLDSDKTQLTPGTSGCLFVRTERRNGFAGAIQLAVENLPAGVTAHCGQILPGGQDGCIIFEAAGNASLAITNAVISGTEIQTAETPNGPPLSSVARAMQETYMPGGGRNHWPVESHAINVGVASDIRSLTLSTHAVTLKPGGSTKIDITFKRAPGFTTNVTLDLLFRHLGTVYGNSLPAGVTIDSGASKTLITGKESRGVIVLKAAKDAKPVEKQQVPVMANVSINFVMKATYSSKPLLVTVAKP